MHRVKKHWIRPALQVKPVSETLGNRSPGNHDGKGGVYS